MKNDNFVSNILSGILYFVLGVVFIAATDELLKTFNYILVCICAILGVIQLLGFFLGKKYKHHNYFDLLIAVVFLWVSLILYVYYGFMINILPILFSLYLFIMASNMIICYLNTREYQNGSGGRYLIFAVIAVVIGLLLIFNPGSVIITYLKVTGVYLIMVSIFSFMEFFRKGDRVKK